MPDSNEPRTRRGHRVLALLQVTLVAALLASCSPSSESDDGGGEDSVSTLTIHPVASVPADLADLHARIVRFRQNGLITESANLQKQLVDALAVRWGNRDERLISYHYNLCLCYQHGGALELALRESENAIERWPRSLQHHAVIAIVRMLISRNTGRIVEGTREAVERILAEDLRSKLRSIRIEPADVHVQWADVLFRAGKSEDTLEQIEKALVIDKESFKARALKSECLLRIGRATEALPLLERLVEESTEIRLHANLGLAYARSAEPAKAWKRIERVHERLTSEGLRDAGQRELDRLLRCEGAHALNALERYAEARDFLLPWIVDHPEDRKALDELSSSLHGLGLTASAEALTRRQQELEPYRRHLEDAESFRRVGHTPTVAHNETRAWLEIGRIGDAIASVKKGIEASPNAEELYLDQAEAYFRLGRVRGVAAQLNRVMRLLRSQRLGLRLSRLLTRLGREENAKAIVSGVETNLPEDGAKRPQIRAELARAKLDLGTADAAWKILDDDPEGKMMNTSSDLVILLRAEQYLSVGDVAAARAAVSQNFRRLIDGETWAGALRLVLDAVASETETNDVDAKPLANLDLSDLIDHSTLVDRLKGYEAVRKSDRATRLLERSSEIARKRAEILARMKDFSDSDVLSLWFELAELLLEGKAIRKAREVAWFLWQRNPRAVKENSLLARTLSRPEEILTRWNALQASAGKDAAHPELVSELARDRKALGVAR